MNGTFSTRLSAILPNGTTFPVAHLTPDRVVLSDLTPGVNPFAPYRIGDTMPLTLLAERDGRREQMPVEARLDDLFAGEAHFGLPYGFAAPTSVASDPAFSPPAMPTPARSAVPAVPMMAVPGTMAVPAMVYAPQEDLDTTDREEIMRQQVAPVQTATYYTPTTGLAATSSLPPSVAAQALPEDDRPAGSVAGRLVGFVLGGLFLLLLLGLLLWQRSGIQSVQASLRGVSSEVAATSEGVLRTMPTVGERLTPANRVQITSAEGGTPAEIRQAVNDQQALVDQTTEMLEQARALANDRNNFVRTYGGGDGGSSSRTVVVSGGGSGGRGSSSVVTSSPAEIEAAQARVDAARVRLNEAQGELNGAQRLVDGGAMTRGELESRRANVAAREADLRAREAELRAEQTPRVRSHSSGGSGRGGETRTITTSRGGGSRSSYDAAGHISARMRVIGLERDLARMQADLRTAQARLAATTGADSTGASASTPIPPGSVVTNILRPAGSYVRPGDPIMTIEGGGTPTVVAYFPFREARLIKVGASATVSMPSIGANVGARVASMGTEAVSPNERYRVANENQLVPVSLVMDNVPPGAVPGIQADVTIIVGLGTIFRGRLYH